MTIFTQSGNRAGLVTVLALVFIGVPAMGQGEGRGAGRLTPEERESVWLLEAGSVSADLGLDTSKTQQLAAAYKVSRGRLQKAIEATLSKNYAEVRERFEAMFQARSVENELFAKDLETFLDKDQSQKAVEQLAAFSGMGDDAVKKMSDLVSDQDTLRKAVHVLNLHLIKFNSVIAGVMSGGGGVPEERREEMRKLIDDLNAELGTILTEDQLLKWKESTADVARGSGR